MNATLGGKDARKNKHKLKLGSTLNKRAMVAKPIELIKSNSGKISVQISHRESPDRKKSTDSDHQKLNI